jgi:NTP pyrophosphatase (non-canonical NTP hydrolase)
LSKLPDKHRYHNINHNQKGTAVTNIYNIIQTCAETTKAKGFDMSQHATLISMIGTELAEALEHVTPPGNYEVAKYMVAIRTASQQLQAYRMLANEHEDTSTVTDANRLDEELADIVLRIFSYEGANDRQACFVRALLAKAETNKERPHKHGRGF